MRNLFFLFLITICSFHSVRGQEKKRLSLEDCIEIAIQNNLTVRRSQLNLVSSEIDLMQARGQRYPTLNVGGNYGFNWGRGIDPTTNQFINQRVNFNGLNGNSNVALFRGMQITNNIKQSKLNVEASRLDVARSANDISLNVALTYLNVILNKELLENANYQLASSEQQLDQTKKMVAAGALPVSNELQLSSQLATNEVNVINAENNLDLALLTLKQSLLLPPGEDIDIIIPEVEIRQEEIESSSIQEIFALASANQPEIQSADLRVKSANVGLQVSKGVRYPSLNLSGGFSTNYSDAIGQRFVTDGSDGTIVQSPTDLVTENGVQIFENITVPGGAFENYGVTDQWSDNLSRTLSIGLSVPIFNGFSTRAGIQRAKIGIQTAEITSVEERNNLYQSIETAYRNALAASKTYAASKRQVEALAETFRAIEKQYNLGASNFTDYQVASNNLFQANSDLARAKYDFIFRKKVLEFYQGKPLSF